MKKIKIEKKLSLNKETITKLNEGQLNNVMGGAPVTAPCATNQTVRYSNCITCLTGDAGGSVGC
jgi:natural product precursor